MDDISIRPKRDGELVAMRDACQRAASALVFAGGLVAEGKTTEEIDAAVHEYIVGMGCYPSPLGYNGFPKSICTSINEVLCHGIPDDRPLVKGDILNIDVSVYTKQGYHGDCSEMYIVGECDERAHHLIASTRSALTAAIAVCGPDVPFCSIGQTIHAHVEECSAKGGFLQVVDEFTGHGIGTEFHMLPYIVHTPNDYPGLMRPGHTFTIEPVLVEGKTSFKIWPDKWTAVASDYGRGAQVEHTVLITANGHEILTKTK